MNQRSSRVMMTMSLAVLLLGIGGCYKPDGGGGLGSADAIFTYISTPSQPTTVSIVDTRSDEAFFVMMIPVGKQLSMRFLADGGDGIYTPDRLQYAVWDAGTSSGSLSSQLTCPPASSRRIDLSYRPAPEWPEKNERPELIINKDADQPPGHWTPEGGPLPKQKTNIYD